MSLINERLKRVETEIRRQKNDLPLIRAVYISPLREDTAEPSEAAWDALRERARQGYSWDMAGEEGLRLREELCAHPNPKAFIDGLNEEEFSGMMNAIGFFVRPEYPSEPTWQERIAARA